MLQPTLTDAAIVVLLYTLAAYRPRRQSLTGLLFCLIGSGIAIYGWTFTYRGLTLLAVAALGATFVATWVLGDSTAYRRVYYVSLEERLASAERARNLEEKRPRRWRSRRRGCAASNATCTTARRCGSPRWR